MEQYNSQNWSGTASELTRSALDFSWSLSLFSVQQMANMMTPAKAAAAFENVSRAMQLELNESLQSAFRAGESFQNQLARTLPGQVTSPATDPPTADPVTPQPGGPAVQGWGRIPYPVVPPSPADAAGPATPTRAISADYPFEPNYVDVFGSRMHYVDVGSGDPIVLLHGNPTWSYLWRNIIPYLQPLGRCIAPDLIGYGRSDKPDIEYRWKDHSRYLEEFIRKLGLRNITLVLHDQGSGLGFHYAMRNQQNIKGIAFFEAIIRPYRWDQFSTPEFRELFRQFRSGGVGGEGWKMIVDQNVFIEGLLPQSAGRPLSETEMNYYREPFKDPSSRVPVWQFPRQTAIGGEPPDVAEAVSNYSRKLQKSRLPKLLLHAKPGALVTQEHLTWAKQKINNLETFDLGAGSHFLQESSPHEIGEAVADWIRRLPGNEKLRNGSSGRPSKPAAAPAGPVASGPTNRPGVSAEAVQQLIDEAAYFNLYSAPDTSRVDTAIYSNNATVGFHVTEALHPFEMTDPATKRHRIGRFSHRWMIVPDNYVATPGRVPPPTPLNASVSQRMVMLDGVCTFGDGRDGFHGFGTGQTMPTVVNGRSRLLVTAVGTILEGFGRFAGHDRGTYVYCGELSDNGGFTGNLMLRVMDQEKTLHTAASRPATQWQQASDGHCTYAIFRGEAVPSDPVRPKMGPDGKPIGLIVQQGLTLQHTMSSWTPDKGLQTSSQTGTRRIGRITAHVVFDPQSASGTNPDPVPFTAYDEIEFFGPHGDVVATLIADSSDGRVFNTLISGQQAIRFGGVGRIQSGSGVLQGIDGLMTDNSVVVFEPHVSASIYVLRINDPDRRFQAALSNLGQ